MKKKYLFIVILLSLSTVLFCQNKHSITLSPGSLFLARFNVKYEKLNDSRITYGSRFEFSTAWRSLMVVPYGRIYPFSKESNGLYAEGGVGFRSTFLEDEFWDDPNLSYEKFAPIVRIMIGGQWFAGTKNNIPFDIGL